jgi:hypothetical protein
VQSDFLWQRSVRNKSASYWTAGPISGIIKLFIFINVHVFTLSSPELEAQVSYSDHMLSVVTLHVRLSVNVYIFGFSRTITPILVRLNTNHPWGGDSNLFK